MKITEALDLAEKARSIGLQWFEEPVANNEFQSYQLLRNKCGIALAMGEREYDLEALKNLIRLNALDLWQPDLIRLGGVEAGEIQLHWPKLTVFPFCLIITKTMTYLCFAP